MIIFSSGLDNEEKKIFEEVFGKNKIVFDKYETKGMAGGALDIQIIINILNDPAMTALLHGTEFISLIAIIVKRLFGRNTKNIMDNNSRPRYTGLILRMETFWVAISNANSKNKIFISKISSDFKEIKKQIEKGEDEYSVEKLKEYLKNE